jgi:hypothetical protein
LTYYALGYSVEDVYVLKVHPRNITISEKATIRDASGVRKFTRQDLENVLRVGAKDAQCRVYLSATRFDGEDVGHFQYHGTRTDDPNDRIPHEHRRELRAGRVFAAWVGPSPTCKRTMHSGRASGVAILRRGDSRDCPAGRLRRS